MWSRGRRLPTLALRSDLLASESSSFSSSLVRDLHESLYTHMLGGSLPSEHMSTASYMRLPGETVLPSTIVPDEAYMHTGGPCYLVFCIVRWICALLTVVSCNCAGMTGERLLGCFCFRALNRTPSSSARAPSSVGVVDLEAGTAPEGPVRASLVGATGDSPVSSARGPADPKATVLPRGRASDDSAGAASVDRMSHEEDQGITQTRRYPNNTFELLAAVELCTGTFNF